MKCHFRDFTLYSFIIFFFTIFKRWFDAFFLSLTLLLLLSFSHTHTVIQSTNSLTLLIHSWIVLLANLCLYKPKTWSHKVDKMNGECVEKDAKKIMSWLVKVRWWLRQWQKDRSYRKKVSEREMVDWMKFARNEQSTSYSTLDTRIYSIQIKKNIKWCDCDLSFTLLFVHSIAFRQSHITHMQTHAKTRKHMNTHTCTYVVKV